MRYTERWAVGVAGACLLAAASFAVFARARRQPEPRAAASVTASTASPEIMSVESGVFAANRWYVADGRTHMVHVLDSTGRHLRSLGRRGQGPGEFQTPLLVAASGAFVYAVELGRPDVSVFDTSGEFRQHLKASNACPMGRVVSLAALADTLFALRRCLELPRRLRYQLERGTNGARFEPWLLADTVATNSNGSVPINIRLVAAAPGRLVVGNGDTGCLRVFRLPDGQALDSKCLYGINRALVPAESRKRRRVSFGDSLPRFAGLVLRADGPAVQSLHTMDSATWLEFDWNATEQSRGRALGRSIAGPSFLSRDNQLIVHDDADGVRIEVIRVRH